MFFPHSIVVYVYVCEGVLPWFVGKTNACDDPQHGGNIFCSFSVNSVVIGFTALEFSLRVKIRFVIYYQQAILSSYRVG